MCRQKSIKIPNMAFRASPPVEWNCSMSTDGQNMTRFIAVICSIFSKGPKVQWYSF